jgi:hypothetical protein
MTENVPDHALQEIATTFRCHSSMAESIANRIRERLGQPVSNAEIARVMKSIPPTRLSIDTVIAKLEKQLQRKPRVPKPPRAEKPPKAPRRAAKPSAASSPAPRERVSLQDQLAAVLRDNWKRAKAEKLQAPSLDVEEFIKAVRGYTGYKDAPVRRILSAARMLDRKEVLLTPNVVADKVNELATHGDEE